jgi:RHS repeat-associated protein
MRFRDTLAILASILMLSALSAGAQTAVNLAYDGDGNLVAKTVNGVTTKYLIDDLNPTGLPQVMEETANGVVQRRYTYGRQRISETQFINGAWTTSYYGYDGQGNVRQLTNSAGVVTDTYDYDAYGNLVNHTGTTPNVYLYRGERYDPDMGLYYMCGRWYNPLTGRFMSRDPNEECCSNSIPEAAKNKYIYADSDPVNRVDPSGRSTAVEDEEIEGEVDLSTVGRKTVPKGAFWGGIGLTGFGLEVACMYYTESAGVRVVGQNVGGLQDPKLLPKICSAISSKVPGRDIGPYPAPFYPDENWAMTPGNPWTCEANAEGRIIECRKRCPNGGEEWFTWDDGTKTGEPPHWDYHRCDNTTCKIYTDGTSTCPPEP